MTGLVEAPELGLVAVGRMVPATAMVTTAATRIVTRIVMSRCSRATVVQTLAPVPVAALELELEQEVELELERGLPRKGAVLAMVEQA